MKKKSSKDNGVPRSKAAGRAATGSLRSVAKKRPSPSHPSRADAQKAERHQLYKQMLRKAPKHDLDYYFDSGPLGFCELLYHLPTTRRDPNRLPELRAQKPADARAYWWGTGEWVPRRKALRAAIKDSAPKKTTPTLKRKP